MSPSSQLRLGWRGFAVRRLEKLLVVSLLPCFQDHGTKDDQRDNEDDKDFPDHGYGLVGARRVSCLTRATANATNALSDLSSRVPEFHSLTSS